MTPCTRSTIVIALIICLALPAWGQQYHLYTSQPVTSSQKINSQDGILVQEIIIQKGDTLYDLSRKFSGHGMYFPQILLFNSIRNPDLIYPGNILKVPVTQKKSHDSERVEIKPIDASLKTKATGGTKKTVVQAKNKKLPGSQSSAGQAVPLPVTPKNVSAAKANDGQKLFEAAVKAYRQDDCRSALTLLDRYLADNPGSSLAADAILYKAECYLKLSAQ